MTTEPTARPAASHDGIAGDAGTHVAAFATVLDVTAARAMRHRRGGHQGAWEHHRSAFVTDLAGAQTPPLVGAASNPEGQALWALP